MKKVMFVIVSAMIMVACGSQETTKTEVVDSTSVAPVSDSVAVLDSAHVVL